MPILNPNTPLAFLTPEQAYQTSVSTYVLVGSLGVLLWDFLDNISDDFSIVFRSPFKLSTAAFIGSRLGSLGYVIGADIFATAPTGNCVHFETIDDVFYPISLSCSALLFFFRLRAIYNRNRIVVFCFFILWCGLLTCTIFIPAGILGGTIGPTKYCVDEDVPNSAYAAIIAPLVHDTLVFIAISWRLVLNARIEGDLKQNFQVAMFGKYLPAFSKGLLLDGQRYYLITLISNMVTVIMVFDTSVPIPLRSMCATPNLVLTNIMACRVYRRTKAGLFREVEVSTTALSEKNRKPNIPIAFYTSHTKATTDAPYPVDIECIELPRLPMSPASNISHPSDGSHSKTYEGSLSASTITTHERKNNYPGSFLDVGQGVD
ncbi:hypothetical protein HYPSUDRAFT_145589 [Hypholoma sublateritium FD-334 SS-4]|uniref:Glucose receptor Git3 N-terminal domain-containing protein n=1 Tax=Hypholoma sublateritium (strain FD-334 SS-4) TaxID=945553 RepID=A0A0D2PCT1_HYPSF|nr:hypothetical protein HYPSUDRAFT_145589 [Hypholoma sublateritium FD-334 SS-4]